MRVKALLVISLWCFCALARADLLVIVHASNPVERLDHKQVVDLFMGKVSAFPNGDAVRPLDLPSGVPIRGTFYRALTGKSEAQVDAYWATLVFAGRMSPPMQFANEQALIEAVASMPSAIAYVPRQALPSSVKVIMELPTP